MGCLVAVGSGSRSEGWLAAVQRLRGQVRDSACVDDASLATFPVPPSPAQVQVRSRTPESIAMEADAKGPNPSFVAFNQTWDEGWQLSMDERPAPLLRTEVSLSGFVVPPGKHRIVIAYSDSWVTTGAGSVTAGAAASLAGTTSF